MRLKIAVKVIAFCTILLLFINRLYDVFSWKDTAGFYYSSMNTLYEMEEDLVDVLFLGSSRCYCSINNAVLWEEQGISSFNLAISGQDLASSYHCFVEALKTQTPEVVCLELYGTLFHGYMAESNLYRNTLPYEYSANAVSVVKSIAEDRQEELLLRWPIVHTRYKELEREDFETDRPVYIGYHAEFRVQPVDAMCTYMGKEKEPIGEEEEMWLRKIIALAEEKDIELCFFVAPFVSTAKDQKNLNYVAGIAKEHDIPVLNMTKMKELVPIDEAVDFIDAGHTNYHGSKKVSSYMGQFLRENYGLVDRRGQEGYELWEENSTLRSHEYQNQLLKGNYDITSYLSTVLSLQDYTIIITTDKDYISLNVDLEDFVYSMGLEGFYDAPGCWIIEDGRQVFASVGVDMIEYRDIADDYLAVSRTDGVSNIIINKQSYVKTENGMNIVVYDNLLGEVVDAVALDVQRQGEVVK